jgi:hypothetical protein
MLAWAAVLMKCETRRSGSFALSRARDDACEIFKPLAKFVSGGIL